MIKNEVTWCKLLRKIINSRIEVVVETKSGKTFGNDLRSEVFGKIFNIPALKILRKDINQGNVLITFKFSDRIEIVLLEDGITGIEISFFNGKDCWFRHKESCKEFYWGFSTPTITYLIPFEKFPLKEV